MKYPNPTFLKTASKVKHTRRTRLIIAIVCLCLITAAVLFVLKMASMQDKYRKDFPQLVGAATATTKEPTPTPTPTPKPTETTTEATSETTTELAPSFATTEPTTESTEETEPTPQDNSVDEFEELATDIHFKTKHPLQSVPHDIRDQYLDDLKESLEKYINENCNDARVCFYYVNLQSNETMGVDELDPIVPASSYTLPIVTDYCALCKTGVCYPYQVATFNESAPGNSSYIADCYQPGKQFYLRTLAYYAVAYNDNTALSLLMAKMGSQESLVGRINAISSYVDYSKSVLYTDRNGNPIQGPSRSSCYDLSKYCENLYYSYKNDPVTYQSLINDLYCSKIPTGYRTAFGDEALILHMAGRNEAFDSYTDIAIIDADEPIVVCISVECGSYDRSVEITTDLATFLASYMESLH